VTEEKTIIDNYQIKISLDDSTPGAFTWDLQIMRIDTRKMFTHKIHSELPFLSREEAIENATYVAKNWIERQKIEN
jgi:hypothetical protein